MKNCKEITSKTVASHVVIAVQTHLDLMRKVEKRLKSPALTPHETEVLNTFISDYRFLSELGYLLTEGGECDDILIEYPVELRRLYAFSTGLHINYHVRAYVYEAL
jgi:hypothetical protein